MSTLLAIEEERASARVEAGSRLKHYEILSRLGEGGMGVVYRALDDRLGRTVALKLLPEDLANDEECVRRFEREARAASAISHPSVATLYDFDREGRTAFLAMEYVEGRNLRELLRRGRLPVEQVLDCARQVAEGLASAHAKGVVHRDLKPENVMAADSGYYKILDFGLARFTPEAVEGDSPDPSRPVSQEVTRAGRVLGTVTYMSPEQAQGQAIDSRSDVFTFGTLVHELATGKPPFKRRNEIATFHAIVHEEPRPLTELRPDLPTGLESIVLRCLAKDPQERYASGAELAADLRALTGGSGVSRPAFRPPGARPPSRRRGLWLALGGAAVLAAALVPAIWTMRPEAPPAPRSAPPARPAEVLPVSQGGAVGPVAVTFFTNNSGDAAAEGLSRSLPEMLTTDLARSEGLEVISTQRLYDLLAVAGRSDMERLDRVTAAELAHWAGAGVVVSGSIFRSGETYRIDAVAYETATGQVLTAHKVEGREIFEMVDQLSSELRRGLQVATAEAEALETVVTASADAFRHFSRGLSAYEALELDQAADLFRDCLEVDPEFELARFRLGLSLYLGGQVEEGRRRVLDLDASAERLPGRDRMLLEALQAYMGARDMAVVQERLEARADLFPQDPEGSFWRAQAVADLTGDRLRAIGILRRELARDPGNAMVVAALAGHLADLGLAEEAEGILEDFRRRRPGVSIAALPVIVTES
jgi:TolB-like protein/predicted Ser/Thr protein kinase